MSHSSLNEGSLDLRSFRHDLRGLLTPLSIGLECMKSGEEADGLMLQEEVLKKLTKIVEQLDTIVAQADKAERKSR